MKKKGKLFRILEFHEEEKTKKQIVKISITIRQGKKAIKFNKNRAKNMHT